MNLADGKLLIEIGVQNKATLNFVTVPLCKGITIKSRLFDDLKLNVASLTTIKDVKALIVSHINPTKDFCRQLIAFELQLTKGKTVFEDDNRTLTNYGIQNEATLTCSNYRPKAKQQPRQPTLADASTAAGSTTDASTAAASTAAGSTTDASTAAASTTDAS